jgi:hypothetical protein
MEKLPRQRRVAQSNWETAGGGERISGNTNLLTIDEEKSGGLTSLRKRWGKGQSSTNRTGQEQPRDTCGTRFHEKDAPSSGGLQAFWPARLRIRKLAAGKKGKSHGRSSCATRLDKEKTATYGGGEERRPLNLRKQTALAIDPWSW